jgi:hypothetical protein
LIRNLMKSPCLSTSDLICPAKVNYSQFRRHQQYRIISQVLPSSLRSKSNRARH